MAAPSALLSVPPADARPSRPSRALPEGRPQAKAGGNHAAGQQQARGNDPPSPRGGAAKPRARLGCGPPIVTLTRERRPRRRQGPHAPRRAPSPPHLRPGATPPARSPRPHLTVEPRRKGVAAGCGASGAAAFVGALDYRGAASPGVAAQRHRRHAGQGPSCRDVEPVDGDEGRFGERCRARPRGPPSIPAR